MTMNTIGPVLHPNRQLRNDKHWIIDRAYDKTDDPTDGYDIVESHRFDDWREARQTFKALVTPLESKCHLFLARKQQMVDGVYVIITLDCGYGAVD
jgi:hypothetical protein